MYTESLNKVFERSIRENWSRPAFSNYNGETLTFGQVAEKIARIHMAFEEFGIKPGEKIALCSKNQANWAVSFMAVVTYGAVAVPLLNDFKPSSIQNLIEHSDSRILFASQQIIESLSENRIAHLEAVCDLNTLCLEYCRDKKHASFVENISEAYSRRYPDGIKPEDVNYYEDKPDDLMIISYTSGTTGFSKGVMLPARSIHSNIDFGDVAGFEIDNTSTVVAMLPSAHMYGMLFEFLYEFSIGCHIVFLNKVPSPNVIMKVLSEIKPGLIMAVPLIIEKIYKYLVVPKKDSVSDDEMRERLYSAFGGNFSEFVIGGAALNKEVDKYLSRIKFPYSVGYGMTECGPIITFVPWREARCYSCGKAALNVSIKIDSSDPMNEPGEVLVSSPNVFLGYYKNPTATRQAFTSDGWLRTGDIGVIDKDGYLYLKGRSKSLILGPNGQNIYPEELEGILNNSPFISESLVILEKGVLTALVYPNFELEQSKSMDSDQLQAAIKESVNEANKELPLFCQIGKVEIMPEEFEKTPKKNIKRFLYQR